MEKLIEYLEEQIEKNSDIDPNTANWHRKEGILIVPNHAKKIIDFYNQHQWGKDKPVPTPCTFISKNKYGYAIFHVRYKSNLEDGAKYLVLFNDYGEEMSFEELKADKYLIIERADE